MSTSLEVIRGRGRGREEDKFLNIESITHVGVYFLLQGIR